LSANAFVDQILVTVVESPNKTGRNTKKIDYDEDFDSLKVDSFISHPKISSNFKFAKGFSVTRVLITPPSVRRIT
jgi:hypothetical protein